MKISLGCEELMTDEESHSRVDMTRGGDVGTSKRSDGGVKEW